MAKQYFKVVEVDNNFCICLNVLYLELYYAINWVTYMLNIISVKIIIFIIVIILNFCMPTLNTNMVVYRLIMKL